MSLISEIHSQRPTVRKALWLLSAFIAISFVGFFWFTSVERQMYLALHTDPDEQADFLARQQDRSPKPLAAIGRGFGAMTAVIGNALGLNREAGFDRAPSEDTVHLLPLSD